MANHNTIFTKSDRRILIAKLLKLQKITEHNLQFNIDYLKPKMPARIHSKIIGQYNRKLRQIQSLLDTLNLLI